MLFQCIDTDHDGILTVDEFVELYDKMNNIDQPNQLQNSGDKGKFEQEISQFLEILDPDHCDKITLSDIIQLFSTYKVDLMASDDSTSTQRNSQNHSLNLHHPIGGQINLHQISEKFERNDTGEVNDSNFSSKHYKVAGESDDVYEDQDQNLDDLEIEKQERMLNDDLVKID